MEKKPIDLDEEGIVNVRALGEVLYKIHVRLIKEGYTITKDEIIDPKGKIIYSKSEKC